MKQCPENHFEQTRQNEAVGRAAPAQTRTLFLKGAFVMKTLKQLTVSTLALAPLAGVLAFAPTADGALVTDDFNRSDSSTLGTMSDGVNSWVEFEGGGANNTRINNNRMALRRFGGDGDSGAAVSGLTLANGAVEMDIVAVAGGAAFFEQGFGYRADTEFDAAQNRDGNSENGYRIGIAGDFSGTDDLVLYTGRGDAGEVLGTADLGDSFSAFNVRVEFQGSNHTVFVDDTEVINATDSTFSTGAIGVGQRLLGQDFVIDNFTVVPEPASLSMGMLGMGLLALRRRR